MTEFYNLRNWYNTLNAKEKKETLNASYLHLISNLASEMFILTDTTTGEELKQVDKFAIFAACINNGTTFIERTKNNTFIICPGGFVGVPKDDELVPNRYLCTKATDEGQFTHDGEIGENQTVAYIMPDMLPLSIANKFANDLAEVDVSLNNNIIFARIAPIAAVSNDKTAEQYDKCLERMITGELYNHITSPYEPLKGVPTPVNVVDISNGDYSSKIQFLSMYHDQLLSRICKISGLKYNFISKQANITEDEINNGEEFGAVLPLMFLKCCKEWGKKIGISVKFSKPWEWIEHIDEERHDEDSPEDTSKEETEEPTEEKGVSEDVAGE